MSYSDGLARLEGRARLAKGVVWLFVAVAAMTVIGELFEAAGTVDTAVDTGPLALAVALVYMLYTLVFVACVVLVAMWIHRAHANLQEAGLDGLEFTPGWAVGWYFIPFANLFKPFQAMRELWNASHAEVDRFANQAPTEVKLWWGAWIIGNILGSISTRILLLGEGGEGALTTAHVLGVASSALAVAAALLLVRLIDGITTAQRSGGTAASVFA